MRVRGSGGRERKEVEILYVAVTFCSNKVASSATLLFKPNFGVKAPPIPEGCSPPHLPVFRSCRCSRLAASNPTSAPGLAQTGNFFTSFVPRRCMTISFAGQRSCVIHQRHQAISMLTVTTSRHHAPATLASPESSHRCGRSFQVAASDGFVSIYVLSKCRRGYKESSPPIEVVYLSSSYQISSPDGLDK